MSPSATRWDGIAQRSKKTAGRVRTMYLKAVNHGVSHTLKSSSSETVPSMIGSLVEKSAKTS